MILGIGVDLVRVERMRRWTGVPGLCERFFQARELEGARANGAGAAESLAARFAAKEAFGKAMGTGLRGFALRDVEVVNGRYGKPEIGLAGTARKALRSLGGKRVFLSLAHERDNAVAMVVIEG
jgi:holo-[acyl-carrier protein] synthase